MFQFTITNADGVNIGAYDIPAQTAYVLVDRCWYSIADSVRSSFIPRWEVDATFDVIPQRLFFMGWTEVINGFNECAHFEILYIH